MFPHFLGCRGTENAEHATNQRRYHQQREII